MSGTVTVAARVASCVLCAGFIFAASDNGAVPSGAPTAKDSATVARKPDDAAYKIGIGDILQVLVWKQPDASVQAVQVRSDGRITLPFAREVDVTGMTTTEAESAISQRLSPYFKDPDISVMVKETISAKIYVLGGVRREGSIPLKTPLTVLQALSEAGGVSEYAKRKKIYIMRTVDGKPVRLLFNYDQVVRGDAPDQNIMVVAGDTIFVPR